MSLALPEEALPFNPLDQFASPYLIAFRSFEAVRDAQLEWWRAWCGLLGQLAPLPEEEISDKPEADGE